MSHDVRSCQADELRRRERASCSFYCGVNYHLCFLCHSIFFTSHISYISHISIYPVWLAFFAGFSFHPA